MKRLKRFYQIIKQNVINGMIKYMVIMRDTRKYLHPILNMQYKQLKSIINQDKQTLRVLSYLRQNKLQEYNETIAQLEQWKLKNPGQNFPFTIDDWLDVQASKQMVDCDLMPESYEEELQTAKLLQNYKFHTVFVSPLKRSIQTAQRLFRNHPHFKTINFVVHPLLIERLHVAADIPKQRSFQELQQDFSMEPIKERIQLKDINRSHFVMNDIQNYIKQYRVKPHWKIAIVGHSQYFKIHFARNYLQSIGDYEAAIPLDKTVNLQFCEVYPYPNFKDILKHKENLKLNQ
eukprot:403348825